MILSAVDRDRFSGENGFREGEIGHIRASHRAVHGEESEAGDGDAIDVVVGVCDLLAGFLSSGVERRGAIGAVGFGEGDLSLRP